MLQTQVEYGSLCHQEKVTGDGSSFLDEDNSIEFKWCLMMFDSEELKAGLLPLSCLPISVPF